MTYSDHPLFVQPTSLEAPIWRYLDFTKFVSLLVNRELYFCRADQLGDEFEGSYPTANVTRRETAYRALPISDDLIKQVTRNQTDFNRNLAKAMYVNCWSQSDYESVALWNLYSSTTRGVALRSTVQRLIDSLRTSEGPVASVGLVKYINYDADDMPEGNIFHPFLHKRRSFDFERELRAVVLDMTVFEDFPRIRDAPPGLRMQISIGTLIERVHVSPLAPTWFRSLVERISAEFGDGIEVRQSALTSREPVF